MTAKRVCLGAKKDIEVRARFKKYPESIAAAQKAPYFSIGVFISLIWIAEIIAAMRMRILGEKPVFIVFEAGCAPAFTCGAFYWLAMPKLWGQAGGIGWLAKDMS